ncbi:MAG TPA: aminodeoxychorismate lyase, partial [Brevundimonas sp.]|nr:aminodeoxychorismate lyase [Brevundimonas sp.]
IANPGREAIAAVLNPPRSDALFFVADGTGGHAFASTYAEHQQNVARWRAIERQQQGLPPVEVPLQDELAPETGAEITILPRGATPE